MFDEPEIRNKRWMLIGIGTLLGGVLGFLLFREPFAGAFAGYIGGILIGLARYGITRPANPEQKRLMRVITWALSASVILGAVVYGRLTGDIMSSIGAGIGLTFSVGVSLDSLYDERMGRIFSKAARNAFVVLTMGLSVVGFMDEALILAFPWLWGMLGGNQMISLLWVSYAVFAVSWVYHAYYAGE